MGPVWDVLVASQLSLTRLFLLLARLLESPLLLPFSIDARCKGILKAQRSKVHSRHPRGEHQPRRLPKQQRRAQEAHRGAPVHGRAGDVEGKPRDHVVHEDAKVVAEECPRNAEAVRRGEDQDVAQPDERVGGCL
jgi:hypothetical protein